MIVVLPIFGTIIFAAYKIFVWSETIILKGDLDFSIAQLGLLVVIAESAFLACFLTISHYS